MCNKGHKKGTVDHFMRDISVGTMVTKLRLKEFVKATDNGTHIFVLFS